MEKILFSFVLSGIFLLNGLGVCGQKITIEQCQHWARENYPMILQHGLLDKAKVYSIQNLNRTYLPQFSLNGIASWSDGIDLPKTVDVTLDPGQLGGTAQSFPIDIDLPDIGREFYGVGIGLQQVLWAGGRVKAGKEAAEAEANMLHGSVDAQLYAIRSKIKDLFFGILLIDGRIQQLKKTDEVFGKVRERVEVALQQGVAFPADLEAVDVERLKNEQQRIALESRLNGYLSMLSEFIHRPVNSASELQIPGMKMARKGDEISRPELRYLDLKKQRLAADLSMLHAENMPKLGAFVSGGFTRGGFDMEENRKFEPSIVGMLRFTWDFGKLYTTKNEKRMIRLKQDGVDLERETFLFNTRTELIQHNKDVERLQKQLLNDAKIVRLRESIVKASQIKYDNGVYTIAELITDLNAAHIARQEQAIREIELKMVLYTCEIVAGEKESYEKVEK